MTDLSDAAVARLRDAATRPTLAGERYALGALIGRGGMGSVYVARDRLLDREVAVKVSNITIDAIDAAPDAQRIADEARTLARLEHPGIVPVHDAGMTTDGRMFYAMKLVRGRTLGAHVRGVTDLTARLAIFERVVESVAFAHSVGVVHGDLSPANVMIGGFGEVLVLDWGLARPTAGRAAADATPHRAGTRGFMAPEHPAGPPSDVFSLGAILSELVRDLHAPKRLRAIAAKCQSNDPSLRYADAAELSDDLARFRSGRAVGAYRDTAWDHAVVWFGRYGVFAALILAYLIMRAAFALVASR